MRRLAIVLAALLGLLVLPLSAQTLTSRDSVVVQELHIRKWTWASAQPTAQWFAYGHDGETPSRPSITKGTRTARYTLRSSVPAWACLSAAFATRPDTLTKCWAYGPELEPAPAPEPVPTPPATAEPTGFARITERAWDVVVSDGWYHDGDRTRFQLLQDSTRRFIRAPFLAGETGGPHNATPFRVQKNIEALAYGKLYWSFWLRVSPNFQGHPTATNKVNFAWMRRSNILFLSLEGVDAGPLNLMPRLQTYATSDPREYFPPNQGAPATFSRGPWHHVELVAEANTASDRNGRIAVWLDGVKTHDYRDIRFVVTGEGHTWDYVDVTPLWGGNLGTVRQNMEMDYGPMYLSGAR